MSDMNKPIKNEQPDEAYLKKIETGGFCSYRFVDGELVETPVSEKEE